MKNKLLAAVALAFAMSTGAAFAQNANQEGASGEAFAQPPLPGLESFYTDETMTSMRTPDEMRASYDALSAEDRQALKDRCEMSTAEGTDMNTGVDDQTTASTMESDVPQNFAELCAQVNQY